MPLLFFVSRGSVKVEKNLTDPALFTFPTKFKFDI